MRSVTTRLLLVRHARPAVPWDSHPDSGLDATGRAQADALATDLGAGPARPLVVSPLRRTRETAAPLAALWGVEPDVRSAVGEIPAPTGANLEKNILEMARRYTESIESYVKAYPDQWVWMHDRWRTRPPGEAS